MKLRPFLFLAVLLVTATAFAGCTTPKKDGATTTDTAAPMTATVEMKNIKFVPETVTIAKGGTVTWMNKDPFGHDVKAKDGSWQSDGGKGQIDKDASWPKTFDEAGTVEYYCEEHGMSMSGKVIVQ